MRTTNATTLGHPTRDVSSASHCDAPCASARLLESQAVQLAEREAALHKLRQSQLAQRSAEQNEHLAHWLSEYAKASTQGASVATLRNSAPNSAGHPAGLDPSWPHALRNHAHARRGS